MGEKLELLILNGFGVLIVSKSKTEKGTSEFTMLVRILEGKNQ